MVFDEDLMLVRKLAEYSEVVNGAAEELQPHRLCVYLFELAQEFNRYYEKNVVIGTDIAGTAEIIEDGVNGYLYHPDDIEDLCDKLRFVINNWELQEEMVSCAKEYVWKNYDSNRYAEKIFQIYEELSGLSK